MHFPPLFLTVLVIGGVTLAALGATMLAVLFLIDKKSERLW